VPKGNIEIDCKEVWKQISNYLDDDPLISRQNVSCILLPSLPSYLQL
jgi:hypothetical protein